MGLCAFFLGLGWIFSSEPWMLDKAANTILLDESYENLFSKTINRNLPKYLTLLYRFFGLWVSSLGLLLLSYTIVTRLGSGMARGFLHSTFFITLVGISLIEYVFIPSSPFVYLTIVLWLLWAISVWAGLQLKKHVH
jgi:hypothetical protein|tara:strand:- start:1698 stop:2108 length:411 start_codon:yes stop_codon:yes gene_type:complete